MTWQKSKNKIREKKSQKWRWIWKEHKTKTVLKKTNEGAVDSDRDLKGQGNETELKTDSGELGKK